MYTSYLTLSTRQINVLAAAYYSRVKQKAFRSLFKYVTFSESRAINKMCTVSIQPSIAECTNESCKLYWLIYMFYFPKSKIRNLPINFWHIYIFIYLLLNEYLVSFIFMVLRQNIIWTVLLFNNSAFDHIALIAIYFENVQFIICMRSQFNLNSSNKYQNKMYFIFRNVLWIISNVVACSVCYCLLKNSIWLHFIAILLGQKVTFA